MCENIITEKVTKLQVYHGENWGCLQALHLMCTHVRVHTHTIQASC